MGKKWREGRRENVRGGRKKERKGETRTRKRETVQARTAVNMKLAPQLLVVHLPEPARLPDALGLGGEQGRARESQQKDK